MHRIIKTISSMFSVGRDEESGGPAEKKALIKASPNATAYNAASLSHTGETMGVVNAGQTLGSTYPEPKKNKMKQVVQHTYKPSFLSAGTITRGDLEINGDLRLEGRVEGNIVCNGMLIIGLDGYVLGDTTTRSADIYGRVEGDITAAETLILRSGSRIKGHIEVSLLTVDAGAFLDGHCRSGMRTETIDAVDSPAADDLTGPSV